MTDPRNTLIDALLEGTRADTIKWEQANTAATAFIAKRPSGTVTVEGTRSGLVALGSSLFGTAAKLIVKDATGKTVEEIEAPSPTTVGALMSLNPAAAVSKLYDLVHERVTRAEATMANLSREFQKPD
jgi:hypothetical protein